MVQTIRRLWQLAAIGLFGCGAPPYTVFVEAGDTPVNIELSPVSPDTGGVEVVVVSLPPPPPVSEVSPPPEFSTPLPAPSVTLLANGLDGAATIERGKTLILTWSSSNARRIIASGSWRGDRSLSGVEEIADLTWGFYTFVLTALGPGGSVSDSVRVRVVSFPSPPPPPPPPLPPPPLEILTVSLSQPAEGDCYLAGEPVTISVSATRGGEIHYLLPDGLTVGTLRIIDGEGSFVHRFPFPIQEGVAFFWPEDRAEAPDIREVALCVDD